MQPQGAQDRRPPPGLLQPGSRIDHYRVMRRLDQGGMAEVYLARDVSLGRKVALKLINPDLLSSVDAVERFLEEARITARFNHPHIVMVHGVGQYEGRPYIAMEYLEGRTLAERAAERRLSTYETIRIGMAIAEALAEAHRNNVLHLDLKPQNVLIPRDGRLRVLDFGISEVVKSHEYEINRDAPTRVAGKPSPHAEEEGDDEDEDDRVFGTPGYMAPERWAREGVSEATDVWALGVMIYELLAGKRLFFGATGVIMRNITQPRPLPTLQVPDLPKGLQELLERCVALEPSDRPAARDLAAKLGRFIRKRTTAGDEVESPFRGLLPFGERHAGYFFGRDAEIAAFLERLREEAILPVVGPSGAGKSSFISAGIIPRLKERGPWVVLQLRPGRHPFATLSARILAAKGGEEAASSRSDAVPTTARKSRAMKALDHTESAEIKFTVQREELAAMLRERPDQLGLILRQLAESRQAEVLLFVDQLEELYTLVPDAEARRAFMTALCGAADDPHEPIRVVFTVRDDFLGRIAEGPEVREALSRVTVVRSPGPEALRSILESPLEQTDFRYEDAALVDEMLEAVRDEPACLPLLQFTCRALWDLRDENAHVLRRAAYERLGGVAGALAGHADGVLRGLPSHQAQLVPQLMLRLVTAQNTRRLVSRSQLLQGLESGAADVVDQLVKARLLTIRRAPEEREGDVQLELIHESLITGWDRLQRWIDESREEIALLGDLEQAADLWARHGRREGELWEGEALVDARRALQASTRQIPARVTEFLEAGEARVERVHRGARLRRMIGIGVLIVLTVASILVALVLAEKERETKAEKRRADRQRLHAEQQRRVAEQLRVKARERAAEALRESARASVAQGELFNARARLRAALELRDSPLARALWWRLSLNPLLWRRSLSGAIYDLAWSPDGRWFAAGGENRVLLLFDRAHFTRRILRGHSDPIHAVAFSADSKQLASASSTGEIRLWDVDGTAMKVLADPKKGIRRLAFGAQGRLLAAAGPGKIVRVWSLVRSGPPVRYEGHEDWVMSVAFSPDGKIIASSSADGTVRLWQVGNPKAQPRIVKGHAGPVAEVTFSADGRRIATAGTDKTVRVWDSRTGKMLALLRGHQGEVYSVSFHPTRAELASAGLDKTVRVWNLKTRRVRAIFHGHTQEISRVGYTPDGKFLASASHDKTVRIWNPLGPTTAEPTGASGQPVHAAVFSPDGKTIASGGNARAVRLWDVASGRVRWRLLGHLDWVSAVAFSPDGSRVASGSNDTTVRIWDAESGKVAYRLVRHAGTVLGLDFSADGAQLASGGLDRMLHLWDPMLGDHLRRLQGHTGVVTGLAFDPNGERLASVGSDATIRLWSTATGGLARQLRGHRGPVLGVAYSSDGKWLASGGADKTLRVWNLATGQGEILGSHRGRVAKVSFDPSGRYLVVPLSDGTARVWDRGKRRQIRLVGHRGDVNSARFSADGKLVVTAGDDGTVRTWFAGTGRPFWRAPLLTHVPPRAFSHHGWRDLERPTAALKLPNTKWRHAIATNTRVAKATVDDRAVCLLTHDHEVEMWNLERDERLFRSRFDGVRSVEATAAGCLAASAQEVRAYRPGGAFKSLVARVDALLWDGKEVYVGADKRITRYDANLKRIGVYPADAHVTALLRLDKLLILGFRDGNLERWPLLPGDRRPITIAFDGLPASPVVKLAAGPPGIIIAGFANGLLGLWNVADGSRLHHVRLHGPVIHLLRRGGKLYVGTELGDYRVLDLRTFDIPYCKLLAQVWASTPAILVGGRLKVTAPPANHPCRRQHPGRGASR